MADRLRPLSRGARPLFRHASGRAVDRLPARAAGGLLTLVILGPLVAVAWRAGGVSWPDARDAQAIWFTLWQAALSALVSCVLAVPLARALARRRFRGRAVLIALLGAPFILPTIAAVMGLIAIFGRSGVINELLALLGLPPVSIYGAHGVILAHVFLNLPLATRMLLHGWQAIPSERLRLAASLGFSPRDLARHLERPMLAATLPGAFLAIFLVCLTSFAIALTLGGGPRATTIELAIYQAFRFDFDLAHAAGLGLMQVVICVAGLALSRLVTGHEGFGAGQDRPLPPGLAPRGLSRLGDAVVIGAATLFLLAPMAMVVGRGLPALPDLAPNVWQAALVSLAIALGSTALTLAIALPLALAAPRTPWAEACAMLPLAASALVMGTGLFVIARPFTNPTGLIVPVTLLTNATLSVPFALRILMPQVRVLQADYDRLAASLGMVGLARLRHLTLPRLARPLGFSAGIAAAFSMGDLGVITLFSDGRVQTLPLALYQLMGAYRLDQAAGAATLLITLGFGLFFLFDRIGHHADPR